jgi:hypothetical protein
LRKAREKQSIDARLSRGVRPFSRTERCSLSSPKERVSKATVDNVFQIPDASNQGIRTTDDEAKSLQNPRQSTALFDPRSPKLRSVSAPSSAQASSNTRRSRAASFIEVNIQVFLSFSSLTSFFECPSLLNSPRSEHPRQKRGGSPPRRKQKPFNSFPMGKLSTSLKRDMLLVMLSLARRKRNLSACRTYLLSQMLFTTNERTMAFSIILRVLAKVQRRLRHRHLCPLDLGRSLSLM